MKAWVYAAVLFTVVRYIPLIELHAPSGQRVFVNPEHITTIRQPVGADLKYFAPGARCVIVTVTAKFLAVRETCDQVHRMITIKNHGS